MNAIIGMTDLALRTQLTAEQRDYLRTVKESAEALLALINDILDFSKIEAGSCQLDRIAFDLRDAVEDARAAARPARGREGSRARLPHRSRTCPTPSIGDPGRLRQVLVNLVGNAIKFTERGEVMRRRRA